MDVMRMFYKIVLLLFSVHSAWSACTWPAELQNSEWWDSVRGNITFTQSDMSGLSINIVSNNLSVWDCYDSSHFASERILILKNRDAFSYIVTWRAFLCLEFRQLTEHSYLYYHIHPQEINAGKERVYVNLEEQTPTKAEICSSDSRATGREFSVIVRKEFESSVNITCPTAVQGRFGFSFTDASGTLLCNASGAVMDVCTDTSTLNFDPACPGQSLVYADAGVTCVASLIEGTDTVVQLLNVQDVVDGVTTYRFSCMVVSADSTSASIVYNNCTEHQTPTYAARCHDGHQIGSLISLQSLGFCKLPTTTTQSTTTVITIPKSTTTTKAPTTGTSPSTMAPDGIAKSAVGNDEDNRGTITIAVSVSVVAAATVVTLVSLGIWIRRKKKNETGEHISADNDDKDTKPFSNNPVSSSTSSINDVIRDGSSASKTPGIISMEELSAKERTTNADVAL